MRALSLVLGGLLTLLGAGFLLFVGALGGLETTKRVWAEPTASVEAMHRTETGLLQVRVYRERPADEVLPHCTVAAADGAELPLMHDESPLTGVPTSTVDGVEFRGDLRFRPDDEGSYTLICDPAAGRVYAASHVGWLGSPLTWMAGGVIVAGLLLVAFGARPRPRR